MAKVFGTKESRRRRTWLALGVVGALTMLAIPATSFADNPSGCDFSPANNGVEGCVGPLSGSTFAGGDGNLLTNPTAFGTTDWQNVAGLNAGFDLPSGSGDNSFGQGTKEDNANVTVVSGSIPPSKSDLTRFYEASQTVSGQTFLYLAWERTNNLGNANMDFEINQKTQPDLTTPGAKTLNRTAGDLLITYDFTNGGGKPILGLNVWLTSATTPVVPGFSPNVCLSSNTFPCWGDHINLSSSVSEGAVNNLDAVTDPLFPGSPNYQNPVPALRFGEAAINLTGAGVFPPGVCEAFGSAFLKSRASSSFPAEVKDFIAPIPVNIANCGEVVIIKHTDPRGQNQNFSYTSNLTTTPPTGTTACSQGAGTEQSFTLNDNGNTTGDSAANTQDCKFVPVGSYTVVEQGPPANYVLESLTCTTGGSQDGTNPQQANITVTAGQTVTCTYVNKLQLGAIKVTKTSTKGNAPLAGATFSVTGPNNFSTTLTTGSDGTACVGQLSFGTYHVTETSAPSGYDINDPSTHDVDVKTNATCTDNPFTGVSLSFSDTPLTDITATATSEAPGGTQSTITCTGTSDDNVTVLNKSDGPKGSASVGANGLHPGTYTCTIVIDP